MAVPVQPVVYSVTVNGVPVTDVILDVRIEQTWGAHDLVSVRIEYNRMYPMATITPWADNALVTIVWGRRPGNLLTWYGYVNHAEQASNADSGTHNLQYTYYLTGTSKPMNSQVSNVWGSVTATYVAKIIAQKYRLRCVVTSTTTILPNEAQANMSDFAYMNYLAAKTGYRFWVSGGTLYFIDPTVLLQGVSVQAVPTFRQDKLLTQQDTLRDFRLLTGDNLPGSTVATRTISGIDQTTGHMFSASTGSGSVTLANTTRVATSWSQATGILSAWEGLAQFWTGATAEVFGDTGIYPGKVIYLDGTALPGGNIGYWIVMSAKHVLLASGTPNPSNDKYVTQCVVMRNTSATIPKIKQTVTVSPEFTTCTSSNGVWYSTDQRVIYDGVVNGG